MLGNGQWLIVISSSEHVYNMTNDCASNGLTLSMGQHVMLLTAIKPTSGNKNARPIYGKYQMKFHLRMSIY